MPTVVEKEAKRPCSTEELFARHRAQLTRIARHFMRDPHAADEAVSDALYYLVRSGERLVLCDDSETEHYLYLVVKHCCYRLLDQQRRAAMPLPLQGEGAPVTLPRAEERLLNEESQRQLAMAMARLPMREWLVLNLYYADGLRVREIAARLGCPVGTVKSSLHRGRRRLRQQLTAMTEDDGA